MHVQDPCEGGTIENTTLYVLYSMMNMIARISHPNLTSPTKVTWSVITACDHIWWLLMMGSSDQWIKTLSWAAASYLKVEGTVCALRCGFLISSHFTNGRLWLSDILASGVDSTWFFTIYHLTTNNLELGGINPKYVGLESSLDRSKSLLYLVAQEYHSQAGSTRAAIEETILGGTHQNRALPC